MSSTDISRIRYSINASLIYDAADGSIILPGCDMPDRQLSITANALLFYFLQHRGIISREDVLKKVWDDNGLTSSNSNLNQYLSMLRKTFRVYGIENIILSVSRGYLELNPQLNIEVLDSVLLYPVSDEVTPVQAASISVNTIGSKTVLWRCRSFWYYAASFILTVISFLLFTHILINRPKPHPPLLKAISHDQCELMVSNNMLNSITQTAYVKNFDRVRNRLNIACKEGERFVFFYSDKLQTNGLGRVFLAHCAMQGDNPFSYCDNYFYYSWNPQ